MLRVYWHRDGGQCCDVVHQDFSNLDTAKKFAMNKKRIDSRNHYCKNKGVSIDRKNDQGKWEEIWPNPQQRIRIDGK